ncbi:hypothetical protein [Roseovarius aestuarii]|uniref:Uncharacterized protein n=1 Tax=Roseovarius aestuarii TaxID=475083 RepID=A0A1X7BMU0_9RHOB|nr:hypothetical protein [Roseovarius aestuarii]SMC10947.1 hypothetical protein ROA7745_00755 [Roseovarius aestuarii]
MTNQIALALGALILIGLCGDWLMNDLSATLFLSRKLTDMIEWMAFWR